MQGETVKFTERLFC